MGMRPVCEMQFIDFISTGYDILTNYVATARYRAMLPCPMVVRVPIGSTGVALGGKALPNLPPSMVQILGNSRRTGAQPMGGALVSKQQTRWVVQGTESVRFSVTKNKKVLAQQ